MQIHKLISTEYDLTGLIMPGEENVFLIDASYGAVSVTLPDASALEFGTKLTFIAADVTNTVTISPQFGQTVDGATSKTLSYQYDAISYISDLSNYYGVNNSRNNLDFSIQNVSISTSTSISADDYTAGIVNVLVDASGGAVTITLPAASLVQDTLFYIKKTDSSANAVTISPQTGETIDDYT